MSTPGALIQKMLSRPVQQLILTRKRLPNLQVIRLYRQVYKYTSKFDWLNQKGQVWRDVLRKSARRQFDLSKDQQDPLLIMKMMVTTRECLGQLDEKLCATQHRFVQTIEQTKNNREQFHKYS